MAVEDNQKDVPDRLGNVPAPQLDNFRHLQVHSRSSRVPSAPREVRRGSIRKTWGQSDQHAESLPIRVARSGQDAGAF